MNEHELHATESCPGWEYRTVRYGLHEVPPVTPPGLGWETNHERNNGGDFTTTAIEVYQRRRVEMSIPIEFCRSNPEAFLETPTEVVTVSGSSWTMPETSPGSVASLRYSPSTFTFDGHEFDIVGQATHAALIDLAYRARRGERSCIDLLTATTYRIESRTGLYWPMSDDDRERIRTESRAFSDTAQQLAREIQAGNLEAALVLADRVFDEAGQ